MDILNQRLPADILRTVTANVVRRRKSLGITQAALAKQSGVSLGSIKRFEQTSQISLASLVNIAFALGCENDFLGLFSQREYASIDEVVAESRGAHTSRGRQRGRNA